MWCTFYNLQLCINYILWYICSVQREDKIQKQLLLWYSSCCKLRNDIKRGVQAHPTRLMSIKTIYVDTVNRDTGEIIETSTSVYSVADEKFFMMMLTHDGGRWVKSFSNELYVLVLILKKQVQGEMYCSLTLEDRKEIVIESELTKSQVNKIITSLKKKNLIKPISANRVSVNPSFLHYGKTKDIKQKKHIYDRDY